MPDTAKIRSRRVGCSADICQITQILDIPRFVNRFVNTIGNYDKNYINFYLWTLTLNLLTTTLVAPPSNASK